MIVIAGFGLSLLFPQLQAKMELLFSRFSRLVPNTAGYHGFFGGMLVGVSLGLLWTPCVGPILASVITLAATSSVTLTSLFITLAYSIGTALPMFGILVFGRKLFQRPWLLSRLTRIQQIFGVMLLGLALAMFLNFDRKFQAWVLQVFPQYGAGLTRFEEVPLVQKQLSNNMARPSSVLVGQNEKAPELIGGTEWINSAPLRFDSNLQGKVVLIDFWTYSCINCIRTFPYINEWYEKYKDQGFEIVGVHSPEFAFEKSRRNVEEAMEDFGLRYPVVLDNDFAIWNAYQNKYWPAHYLVDKDGYIRYVHFGEGNYDTTENAIRELLGQDPLSSQEQESRSRERISPEIYLGWKRAGNYSQNQQIAVDTVQQFAFPRVQLLNEVTLNGKWTVAREFARTEQDGAQMRLRFQAREVNMVMSSVDERETAFVQVLLDYEPVGEPIPVQEAELYTLVELEGVENRELTIEFPAGVEVYTFTFGQ